MGRSTVGPSARMGACSLVALVVVGCHAEAPGPFGIHVTDTGSSSDAQTGETTAGAGGPAIVEGECATVVEDPVLAMALWEKLELPLGSVIPSDTLAGLGGLEAKELEVGSFAGLECATGLTFLDIEPYDEDQRNDVSDLSPLAGLSRLESLAIGFSRVADLAPLAGLSELMTLAVSSTQVADLGPLANLGSLESLKVANTSVADLSPLADLLALATLVADHTNVNDLEPLERLTLLRKLYVGSTAIDDLSPLTELLALEQLDVSNTGVSDLEALAGLPLKKLVVSETSVSSIEPLSGCEALYWIDIDGTQVADIGALAGLPELNHLDVSRAPVADVSVLSGTALGLLWASEMNLGEVPEDMPMSRAYLWGNGIVDISPLLTWVGPSTVDLAHNEIEDISPLLGIPWSLEYGNCLSIDLRGNPLSHPDTASVMQELCTEFVIALEADGDLGCRNEWCGVVDG